MPAVNKTGGYYVLNIEHELPDKQLIEYFYYTVYQDINNLTSGRQHCNSQI